MLRYLQFLGCVSMYFCSFAMHAQIILSCPDFLVDSPYTYTYSQNFDVLANSGTANAWTDNSTISGWYIGTTKTAGVSTYRGDDGSSTAGDFYSYGITATTDRALGSVASNAFTGGSGSGYNYMAILFKNNTTTDITLTSIAYTGEQWRSANTGAETLLFEYQVSSSVVSETSTSGWSAIAAINFTTPNIVGSGAINGNSAANRLALSTVTSITVASGYYAMLRWKDLNNASVSDHGIGIDDVSIVYTAILDCYTLPVTLTAFSGHVINNVVELQWNTATEIQNDYFELQKSFDGGTYETLAHITGAGNSTSPHSYSYKDELPSITTTYYRLKQVDYNGNYTLSNIIAVSSLHAEHQAVYPNPAANQLNVPEYADEKITHIEIYNAEGSCVYSAPYVSAQMDISRLSKGMYVLRIFRAGDVFNTTFFKN